MNPTDKFTGKAQHYDAGRPSYAEALLDSFYHNYGLSSQSVIADIGSGTGKLTRQLLQRGSRVIAVEPMICATLHSASFSSMLHYKW